MIKMNQLPLSARNGFSRGLCPPGIFTAFDFGSAQKLRDIQTLLVQFSRRNDYKHKEMTRSDYLLN